MPGELSRDGRFDGELVGDERRCVVDESLTFEHGDDAVAEPELAPDTRRRDRIGRRDDGPQHEGHRPRDRRRDLTRDRRHHGHREEHEDDGER